MPSEVRLPPPPDPYLSGFGPPQQILDSLQPALADLNDKSMAPSFLPDMTSQQQLENDKKVWFELQSSL